jgi:hypothetical protein
MAYTTQVFPETMNLLGHPIIMITSNKVKVISLEATLNTNKCVDKLYSLVLVDGTSRL